MHPNLIHSCIVLADYYISDCMLP